ncbi:MAG TPA: septal ring lytic transglycosylase RlpA family lipoprotein [Bacteroidales bacterium]|nr:septal ring lytic transglycosylase RlpA family lipoprotein [Bacteroidales bacterium]
MRITFIAILLGFIIQNGYSQVGFTQEGFASVYAEKFEGRTTASGESYSFRKATCAHLNLPFGTLVKITNLSNNKSVVVRVNDRGPFVPDRIIDISRSAAEKLGITGTTKVKIEVVEGPSQLNVEQPNNIVQTTNQSTKQSVNSSEVKQEIIPENELYELKVNLIQPHGFTIQIGSYKELVNMLRIANDIKISLKKDVRVQVSTLNNEKIYRLFVGSFNTRKEAEIFKEKISKIYPDCFIVELK